MEKKGAPRLQAADLVVLGGTVLTLDPRNSVLPDGAVVIREGRMVSVGPRREIERRYRSRRRIEARGLHVAFCAVHDTGARRSS